MPLTREPYPWEHVESWGYQGLCGRAGEVEKLEGRAPALSVTCPSDLGQVT